MIKSLFHDQGVSIDYNTNFLNSSTKLCDRMKISKWWFAHQRAGKILALIRIIILQEQYITRYLFICNKIIKACPLHLTHAVGK